MKTAFVCNTPYQLFNILNICCNNLEDTNKGSELFIVDRFNSSKIIAEKIRNLKIFNKVYFVVENKIKRRTMHDKIRALFVSKTKFQDFVCSEYDFLGKKYDQIFIGDAMPFGIALCIYNRNAIKFAFEDGVAYYFGDFLHNKPHSLKDNIKKIIGLGLYSIHVKAFYVNSKDMCESRVASEILQLPAWQVDNPALSIVKKAFDFKDNSKIKSNRFIFLDRPFLENEKYNGLNPEELLTSSGLQDVSLIRIHPRSTAEYSMIDIDYGDNIWELECIFTIKDNHVLIGDFSMAQINPKIIADKEPFLIFAYKLFYKNLTEYENNIYRHQIEIAKKAYCNKNKIYIPDDVNEFKCIINKLLIDD